MSEYDIVAMYSNEGEKVVFNKGPKAKGLVEQWLKSVEKAMVDTLQKLMKTGLNDYST